jgi:flavin-dependent dehydrogenase
MSGDVTGGPAVPDRADVVVIGGGPAGAALAIRVARAGLAVVVLERAPVWRWRAGGVFSSPATTDALRALGMPEGTLETVARPIPAMRVETPNGVNLRLTYGTERGGPPAVGFDRRGLDEALLDLAGEAGAVIARGVTAAPVRTGPEGVQVDVEGRGAGERRMLQARIVVGADGPRSIVTAAAGVSRPVRLPHRVGLSWHQADPRGNGPLDARMHVLDDGYVGVAPVPGGRVNVGIVLGVSWQAALARDGAAGVAATVLRRLRPASDDDLAWRETGACDRIAGVAPLGGRVTRRAGLGWFVVGDAAGFLDPFTGEGLHRALVSAELAAPAIGAVVRGTTSAATAAAAYDRAMRRRFATKDAVSWLVQAFLARPAIFEYAARRLATRDDARATMSLVMGDLVPASRALDPWFLARVLRP